MLWLALLVAVGTWLRVHGVDAYHYHADELMHIGIAQGKNLRQVWQFSLMETHPPLGHILRHYWQMLGDSVQFTRGFSLLFGLALIPLYYVTGKKLGGQFCGICAAILITFSQGCIVESYVVRNYTLFLCLLTAAFYAYLAWRENRKTSWLIAYSLCAGLACFTHFSGIFTALCLFAYELSCMLQSKIPRREAANWLLANSIPAMLFWSAYLLWQPALAPVDALARQEMASQNIWEQIALLPSYIISVISYIFPGWPFIFLLVLALIPVINGKNTVLKSTLALAGTTLCFAAALWISRAYPFAGDRHSLWMLPLLAIPMGWLLAEGLQYYNRHLRFFNIIIALTLFTLGLQCANPIYRFDDQTEYGMTETEWRQVSAYLQSLGPDSLIVMGRTDAIMLAPSNLQMYAELGDSNPRNISALAALMPYYRTTLLWNNRRDMRIYKDSMLLAMLEQAKNAGILNRFTHLVFVNTYLNSAPMMHLIECNALDKQITTFPALASATPLAGAEMHKYPVIFVAVKKDDFLNEVLSPIGKAHHCLAQ